MITLGEIREMPEARKLFTLYLTAFILWAILIALLLKIGGMEGEISRSLSAGDQIINAASVYRSYPVAEKQASAGQGADTFNIVSEITDALGLGVRRSQLQASASGVSLQLDRIYGQEMAEFLKTAEERGLRVKTAEIKALPSNEGRVLVATFLWE
ncbi:MAG: hypothetical protein LBQ19_06795 [Synergistaceae bacterium]|jgi:hypothetical protein|nr:hypothetical protein [Synergistaceae bacterium]